MNCTHEHKWFEVIRNFRTEIVMGREPVRYLDIEFRCACGATKTETQEWPA